MKLTETDRRMLRLLTSHPQRTGHLGSLCWPNTNRKPSALARPAGRTLARLRAMGLATWVVVSDDDHGWIVVSEASRIAALRNA